MKILLTGGAGFIASHIADAYLQAGHEVTIVDDLTTGNKRNVNPKAQFVTMDIRDPNLSTLFAKNGFDIVNHHAAQIDVRRSVQDPFLDASINILGTLRLLECCRTYGTRKFIFASSGGATYGECPMRPALETDLQKPESPYGYSKAAAETYIRMYNRFHNLAYTVLRYGNVYGPRQDAKGEAGVISIFTDRLLANEPVTIYGDGSQERDYVFVGDVVSANLAALTKGENAAFNIGTGIPLSVNQLFQKLSAITGSALQPVRAPARPGELQRSVLDPTQAKDKLGWSVTPMDQALQLTIDYFRDQKPLLTGTRKG